MSRVYEMTAGAVIDAEGRTVVNGVVVIYDAETGGNLIPAAALRQADGSAWPIEGVKTDGNGKVKALWPDGAGAEPDRLYADTFRGRWPMMPADLSSRVGQLELNPGGGANITGGGASPDTWVTATAYTAGRIIAINGKTYFAKNSHTSGTTFAGDLTAHWAVAGIDPALAIVTTLTNNGDGTGTGQAVADGVTHTWGTVTSGGGGGGGGGGTPSVWTSKFDPGRFPYAAFFSGVLATTVTDPGGFTWTQLNDDSSGVRNHPWSSEDSVLAVAAESNGYGQTRTTDITAGFAAAGVFFRFGTTQTTNGVIMPLFRFGAIDTGVSGWGMVAARRVAGANKISVYNGQTSTWTDFAPTATYTGTEWLDPTVLGTITADSDGGAGLDVYVAAVRLDGASSKLYVQRKGGSLQTFVWDGTGIGGPRVEVGANTSIPGGLVHGQAGIGVTYVATSATEDQVTAKIAELVATPGGL